MHFDDMDAIQRRLHNAAIVIEGDGNEDGFAQLQLDAIAEIERLKNLLDEVEPKIKSLMKDEIVIAGLVNFETIREAVRQLKTPNSLLTGTRQI